MRLGESMITLSAATIVSEDGNSDLAGLSEPNYEKEFLMRSGVPSNSTPPHPVFMKLRMFG